MENKINLEKELIPVPKLNNETPKKKYIKPLLNNLGDLRNLTLGGSPMTGVDSYGGPYI